MNRNDRILELIFKRMDKGLRHGAVVRCLAMVVVFVMTYLLILPAFTLDQETAAAQGGIDVPAAVQEEAVEEVQEETAAEEEAPAADEYVDQADSYDEYYEDESPADDENYSEADEAAVDETAEAAEEEVLSELVYEGEGYRIAVTGGLEGLPADTVLAVTEIDRDSDEELYTAYEENAREAVKTESGARIAPEFAFARFYDIALISSGEEIEPSSPLEVTITYEKEIQKQLEAETADNVKVIHFAENTETEEVTPEILDSENVDVTINKNKMAETTFAADSFSVYAVVYTVDFHYGTEGATGELSIKGGDSISLGQLMEELGITSAKSRLSILDMKDKKEKPSTASFLEEVESVEFSDPKLLWTGYLEEDCTPADIMTAEKLFVTYPLGLKQEEVLAINHKEYKAGDWLLMSLKPFTSEETLTITMKDGSEINILVTDAQDAVMNG
ncbi:MAG: hypothetical protein E7220_07875, partial [Clostridiales bacterium]|nr:hypothetical protein [Clostridiales bacterium]